MTPIYRPRSDPSPREAGYTLFELLVVVAIVGLLAAIAAPRLGSAREFGNRPRRIAAAGRILAEARAQAMTSGSAVTVASGRLAQAEPALRLVAPDGTSTVRFYADGSSSGGMVLLADRPLLAIDWLSGATSDPAEPRTDGG